MKKLKKGCYTATITPFTENGETVDWPGLEELTNFQISANPLSGIVYVGTTGESPTLDTDEHDAVIKEGARLTDGQCICIAGTGANNTQEAKERTQHAQDCEVDGILLVDPYYNGPSSLEIRKEYVEPIAKDFPELPIIPYIVPGRTGAQLLPQDLAILCKKFANVQTVKEASDNTENMRLTRKYCGNDMIIMSGDDSRIFKMLMDPKIRSSGMISVMSNIAPQAVASIYHHCKKGDIKEAKKINKAMWPLFSIVSLKTMEVSPYGEVLCRARNPLPVKTAMRILGMPSGPCRKPLGKMTEKGFLVVLCALCEIWEKNPWVLNPIADFFNLDIGERLNMPMSRWKDMGLVYTNSYSYGN